MNILTTISRLVVGSLFIVSGLIKANDPVGFSYKLKDYFAPDVLNLEFLIPLVLPFAVLICIVEIVLGFATLFGNRIRIVSWLLLLMIVFFTFLTFYSAYFEKVTDCGCFGDALKLTPWQSFYKDLILLTFVGIIFIRRNHIKPNSLTQDLYFSISSIGLIAIFSIAVISWSFPVLISLIIFVIIYLVKNSTKLSAHSDKFVFGIPAIASVLFSLHVLYHLPIRDFRPYAIGKNISEGMKSCDELGLPCPEYKVIYTLKNKSSGDRITMDSKQYLDQKVWEDSSLTLLADETLSLLVDEGYVPPIHDFSIISSDGEDFTEKFISDTNFVFIIIADDISNNNNQKVSKKINELAAACQDHNISFIGLTSSGYDAIEEFRHEVQAMYEYYSTDQKTIQTILRSNPGLLLLKKGIVKGKWHYNDIPNYEDAIKTAL